MNNFHVHVYNDMERIDILHRIYLMFHFYDLDAHRLIGLDL